MDRFKGPFRVVNTFALLLIAYGLLAQQSSAAPNLGGLAAPMGPGFAYEGRLGSLTGKYDFQFRLYDVSSGGTPLLSTVSAANGVAVEKGEYVVTLKFGETVTSIVTGGALYLDVRYRVASTDPNAPYTQLAGARPQLWSVPYALSLRPGATVQGSLADNTAAITGSTSSPGAYGLKGFSQQSAGVFGQSTKQWGVFGRSFDGQGVYGETYAENTSTVAGVYGTALRAGGIGVIGNAQLANSWGIYGLTSDGNGVRGQATTGTGVVGQSNTGIGVVGKSGTGSAGVFGRSYGVNASGVEGNANAKNAAGVYGKNISGRGVWGYTDSGTAGVFGQSNSGVGSGVEGYANNGATTAGVFGRSAAGVGVWGRNEIGGYAMKAEGNATQSRNMGGWVKAMVIIDPFQPNGNVVFRCYNSQLPAPLASSGNCGFTTYSPFGGWWRINFGFQIDDRFLSVTPYTGTRSGGSFGPVVGAINSVSGNEAIINTYYTDDVPRNESPLTNTQFVLIVY